MFYCKAQQYPLNVNFTTVPNESYIKDTNNEYNKFIGTWKANVGNKAVYIYITKQENRPITRLNKNFFRDVLLIKYKILINDQITESTINISNENIVSTQIGVDNAVMFSYTGGKCGIGWGMIDLKYIDSFHLKWNYQPQSTVVTNKSCSDYPTDGVKINLPYEPADLIFTKQ